MWKPKHRLPRDRTGLRYPSDLSDAEWLIVGRTFPDLCPAKSWPGHRESPDCMLSGCLMVGPASQTGCPIGQV